MGAGLLANAGCQALNVFLIHRIREQARFHIGFVLLEGFVLQAETQLQ